MVSICTSSARYLALIFWCTLTLVSCKSGQKQDPTAVLKPNVIIVFTDDQGYGDLGYHGNPCLKTPQLDAFAGEALELTNFHVGTTCSPSRAGLMTGRNANRNNAWHTIAGCSILLEDEETMAQVFKRNNYQTAMFGKWHLGDNYPFRPHDRGFQNALYHGGGGINQTPDYWNNDYFDDTYFRNGIPEKFTGYCSDVWFDEAIDYISKVGDQPFFLYLAPNAAHSPYNVPSAYAKLYESAPLTEDQKRFYGMISNIDDNFGKLLNALKELGIYDNTILIFMTDNGTANGIKFLKDENRELGYNAGLRGTKGSHYDGGHRVPFFISWPNGNILQKTTINVLSAHVDLLPTLTDLTNISYQAKKPLDGRSLASIFNGQEKRLDRMLVVDTQRDQWPIKGKNSCVMSSEWRLIDGKELYHTLSDPSQKNDLAGQNPNMVAKMQAFYNQWWANAEPDFRYAEIPIGNSHAEIVLITIHDMHTDENLPWNQVQIRKGEFFPKGYYSIKVETDGYYRFKLHRYPPEAGLKLNAAVDAISSNAYRDGLPLGKTLQPTSAQLRIDKTLFEANVDANKTYAELEGELQRGSYQLMSSFKTIDGSEIPSYYTEIEKL
ncbi:MAG: arylsulfatase [Saprospiraceae bacterium]|nr:arylsulfatase [Saprospiraceae bacterium]